MSVLDLIEKGVMKAIDKGAEKLAEGKWVDKAVEGGREFVSENLSGEFAEAGGKILDVIEDNRDDIAVSSATALTAIVSRLSIGQEDDAKRVWLATKATYAERMSALDAAMDAAEKRKTDDDAAWAAFKKIAINILTTGGKAAVSLLMAMV